MTTTQHAGEIPDTTAPTIALLRELRAGHTRKQASNLAFWLYLAVFALFVDGGWLVQSAVRDLQHPPARTGQSLDVLRAAPAALAAFAVLLLLALLRDALWRGPVTLSQPAAEWLLPTPVRRGRLLRPRYRLAAVVALAGGALLGMVPAAVLVTTGLGAPGASHVLPIGGAAMLSTALLTGLGTGLAALTERYQGSWRWLRAATPYIVALAAILAVLGWLAATRLVPSWPGTVVLWSGPWGWAAQGIVAQAGGHAPLWPLATGLLGLATLIALTAGDRAAGWVAAAALRARARTVGDLAAAAVSMDSRGVSTIYRGAAGAYRRARLRLRLPRIARLAVPWRDLVALLRAPSRLIWSVLLALTAGGLGALAVRDNGKSGLVPLAGALVAGYLAASGLCEGARLDGDDPRRSAHLPYQYQTLVWRHAVTPAAILLLTAALPAAVLSLVARHPGWLVLALVTVPVLVAGALVSSFREPMTGGLFTGIDTPMGNTAAVTVLWWYCAGPLLAVGVMIPVLLSAIHAGAGPGPLIRTVILCTGLTWWLVALAMRRAGLRASG